MKKNKNSFKEITLKHVYFWVIAMLFTFGYSLPVKASESGVVTITLDNKTLINDYYIGNGAQWDPYQLNYGNGLLSISDADWQKLYDRLDFMCPQLIRMMINTSSFFKNDEIIPDKEMDVLFRMLDYCRRKKVTVVFGDWGGSVIRHRTETNSVNLKHAAEFVDYLVNKKGFDCIKYYNLINEPNGDWSATNRSYPLWEDAVKQFDENLKELKINNKINLIGPDIAIWNKTESWWIDSCNNQLGNIIKLYDIHTYPSKITVNSGKYASIIQDYFNKIPKDKKIIMGEIGLKFVEKADSTYNNENIKRAKSKKYASIEDSQLFVYDYMYGTDMADALFQAVNAGYSGSVVWMLDDAMHSKEAPDKLKVWGFWNILGDEFFGQEEEIVRPWYYAWALLTKYMPAGSKIYKTDGQENSGVKSIFSGKDGKYLIALVNTSKEPKDVRITSATLQQIKNCKQFIYSDGTLKKESDHQLLPNADHLTLNLKKGISLTMPPESLVVYTSLDY